MAHPLAGKPAPQSCLADIPVIAQAITEYSGAAGISLKVTTANGWFAARPSGTEDIYKPYAESFKSTEHLKQIVAEAQQIVTAALLG